MSDKELTENVKTSGAESTDNLLRQRYSEPKLTFLGTVRDLTQGGSGFGVEGNSQMVGMN